MTKLFITTPAYNETFYSVYVRSLFQLQQALAERKWQSSYATLSFSDIVESRNALLTYWFDKTDATHILFIDADMGFEAQLVLEMVELDEPLVGVVAPKRQVDLNRIAQLAAEGEPAARAIANAHEFVVKGAGHGRRKGFMRVEGCGAGILLIRRDCIATMLQNMPELSDETADFTSPLGRGLERMIRAFDPIRLEQARLSEDYAFCYRWQRRCGGEVWANVEREITHIGLHKFKGRYSDQIEEAEAPADAPAAEVTDLPDLAEQPARQQPIRVTSGRLVVRARRKAEGG